MVDTQYAVWRKRDCTGGIFWPERKGYGYGYLLYGTNSAGCGMERGSINS